MNNQTLLLAVFAVLGAGVGYFIREQFASRRANSLENKTKEDLAQAKTQAQDIVLEAKNKAVSLLEEVKKEEKDRKVSLDRLEERLVKKESELGSLEKDLRVENGKIEAEVEGVKQAKAEVALLKDKVKEELSKIAGLSEGEAKKRLISEIEERSKEELVQIMQSE